MKTSDIFSSSRRVHCVCTGGVGEDKAVDQSVARSEDVKAVREFILFEIFPGVEVDAVAANTRFRIFTRAKIVGLGCVCADE